MHLVLPLLNQLCCRKSNRGAFRGHLSANPLTTKPSWYEESPRFTPLNPTYDKSDLWKQRCPPCPLFLGYSLCAKSMRSNTQRHASRLYNAPQALEKAAVQLPLTWNWCFIKERSISLHQHHTSNKLKPLNAFKLHLFMEEPRGW